MIFFEGVLGILGRSSSTTKFEGESSSLVNKSSGIDLKFNVGDLR